MREINKLKLTGVLYQSSMLLPVAAQGVSSPVENEDSFPLKLETKRNSYA